MLFTSPVFLLFLLCVLLLSRAPLKWNAKKIVLLLASYFFYASWNPPFVILLWISTLVDYNAALRMAASRKPRVRKFFLMLSLCVNLGILGAFKYADFMLNSFIDVAGWTGHEIAHTPFNFILPLGISFYTFQTMSYTIDVYRRKQKPTRNFADFALYVTFFPQLVAGPIVRAGEFLWQLKEERRATPTQLYWGVVLFIVGLFKKVFLADAVFARVVNTVYLSSGDPSFSQAWIGTYAFAGQIFCDFSGYTDMAIATALMLGFRLPDNFRAPYAAIGFSDFWRRWHISLSTWLRDYLYIPLGGNRKGKFRTRVNLMLTMLLGGLWHGAAWTFVIWGALHGLYLGLEHVAKRLSKPGLTDARVVKAVLMLLTFHLVCVGWVFFRAESFSQAIDLTGVMTGLGSGEGVVIQSRWYLYLALLCAWGLVLVHWFMRNRRLEDVSAKAGWSITAVTAGVMLFLTLTTGSPNADFIYFQF